MTDFKKGDLVKYTSNISLRVYGQVGEPKGLVNPKEIGIVLKGPSKNSHYSIYFQCVAHLANVHKSQMEICGK